MNPKILYLLIRLKRRFKMPQSFPWRSAVGKTVICNLQLYRALYSSHVKILCYSFFPVQHRLTDHAKLVHTTKGWKVIAATGEKPVYQEKEPLACEEGKGAVLHSDLISKLQNCKSVSTQIQTFCSLVSIPPEEIQNRKNFKEHLNELFKPYFPRCKTHLFGSTINGLGFKGCDVDLCLQTIFDDKDYVILKAVPTLDSVLDGTIPREVVAYMNPPYMLRFARRILRRHCPDVKEPILLIKARCPILRFYNAKYDVFCDFSCENKFSLLNTRLLQLLHHLDERFGPLAKLIRYWGKYGGFVGDIERFNSYSFSLLVVYFLQNIHLPVLPPITEMIDKSEYLRSGDMDNDEILHQDLKNFERTKNTQSIEELLRDFFFFYMSFDFSKVIQPLTGSSSIPLIDFINDTSHSTEKFEPGTVSIQDPFRHSFNATACAKHKSCKKFLSSLIKACKLYQDKATWIPKNDNWGICSLFIPPVSEREMQKEWAQDRFHKIALPIKNLEAVSKVKEIIQYGLLFECTDFRVINEDLPATNGTLKTLLKMQCKAYHNTWQGRDWHKRKYTNLTANLLELEHSVSLELAKNTTETRRKILCEFQCECKINRNNESVLILELTFKEDKFPPIVAIFLKEFIPHIFSKVSDLD